MMSLLNLPRLPYIFLELISYTVDENGNITQPESADFLLMDVLPTKVSYKETAKKNIIQGIGDNNNVINKAGLAPIKIMLTGTFGQRQIARGGLRVQDGFGRLKEFRELYRKSQSIPTNGMPEKLYLMNYYDFTMHYWFSIDMDTFDLEGDAQRNSKTPFYTCQMTSVGPLINVQAKDPMLRNLKYYVVAQNKADEWNSAMNTFLDENYYAQIVEEIYADMLAYQDALYMANVMIGDYLSVLSNTFLGDIVRGDKLAEIDLFGSILY